MGNLIVYMIAKSFGLAYKLDNMNAKTKYKFLHFIASMYMFVYIYSMNFMKCVKVLIF